MRGLNSTPGELSIPNQCKSIALSHSAPMGSAPGPTHHDVAVEAARPHQRLVQALWEVGGRDDDDACAGWERRRVLL